MTEKRWRAVQVFSTELQKFDVWRRKTAPDAGVYTYRGQRWLSEGADKVAERDAAGGKDSENSGQASLPVDAARASWLAPHLRAVTVPAMPTSSAHQRPAFPWAAVARAKKARASSTGRDACPTDSDTPPLGQPDASSFANSVTTACKKREDHSDVETPASGAGRRRQTLRTLTRRCAPTSPFRARLSRSGARERSVFCAGGQRRL